MDLQLLISGIYIMIGIIAENLPKYTFVFSTGKATVS
jgi:hypothetical protein